MEDIKFYLPKERVFDVIKDGKVELLIANKDFTSFRTLDQLISFKGKTDVKAVKVWVICEKLDELNKSYIAIYKKSHIMKKKDICVYEHKLNDEKLKKYQILEKEREEKAKEIIGDANEFLKNRKSKICSDGSMEKYSPVLNATVLASYCNYHEVDYFLLTGEPLNESVGPKRAGIFHSLQELNNYKEQRQKAYDEMQVSKKDEEQMKENTEKYLEF